MVGTAQEENIEEIETLQNQINTLNENKDKLMIDIKNSLSELFLYNVFALPTKFREELEAFMELYHIVLGEEEEEEIDQEEFDEEQTANNSLEHKEQEMEGTATQQDNSTHFLDLPGSKKQRLEKELINANMELEIISKINKKVKENLQSFQDSVGMTELQNEITECRTTIEEQDVTIVGLRTKEILSTVRIENLKQTIAENATALASLEEKFKQSKIDQKSLVKKQNQEILASNDNLRRELREEYNAKIQTKSKQITELEHQIETQIKTITAIKEEKDQLSLQNSKHTKTIKNLRDNIKKLTTLVTANNSIQEENRRLREELKAAKEKIQSAEANATLVTNTTNITKENIELREELKAAIKKITSLTTQNIALTTTQKEKTEILETQITQNKSLQEQLDAANAKLADEANAIHYLPEEIATFKEQLFSLNEFNLELQRYIVQLTADNNQLIFEASQQQAYAIKVIDQFNLLYGEISDIQTKINTLNRGIPTIAEWLSLDIVKINKDINSFRDLLSHIVSKQDTLTTTEKNSTEENSGDKAALNFNLKYLEIISQIESLNRILSKHVPEYFMMLNNIQNVTQSQVNALLDSFKPLDTPLISGNPASVSGTLFQAQNGFSSTRLKPNGSIVPNSEPPKRSFSA